MDNTTASLNTTYPASPSCVVFKFIVIGCFSGTLGVLGTIGNIMAFIFLQKDKLGKVSAFTLKMLSLVDALFLFLYFICVTFFQIFILLDKIHLVYYAFSYLAGYGFMFAVMMRTAATWITSLISYQRYISVCHPLGMNGLLTMKTTIIQIAAIMVYSVVIVVPRFFEFEYVYVHTEEGALLKRTYSRLWYNEIYQSIYKTGIMIVINKMIPLVSMCIATGYTIYTLKRKFNGMHSSRRHSVQSYTSGTHKLFITKTLIAVVSLYVITNIPNMANDLAFLITNGPEKCDLLDKYTAISNTIVISNSAINVLIYYPFTMSIRKGCCK